MTSKSLPDLIPDVKLKLPKEAERTLAGGALAADGSGPSLVR